MSIRSFNKIPKKELSGIKAETDKIASLFQDRRKELGMTQEEFAEKLDLNVNTVKYIEQGRRIPSLPMLFRIAKALHLEVRFLEKN
jgi:transcriptional regulator with XRE-family HTH domain